MMKGTTMEPVMVEVRPTRIWVESDMMGSRHVVMQHQDFGGPFTYASFHYGYAYTSNSGTHAAAESLARSLGASEPIEHRERSFAMPTPAGLRKQIASMTEMLAILETPNQCDGQPQAKIDHEPALLKPINPRQQGAY
jgi:hypothetical protein